MNQEYIPNKGKEDCKHPVCNIDSIHKYIYCTWCGKEFATNLTDNPKNIANKNSNKK